MTFILITCLPDGGIEEREDPDSWDWSQDLDVEIFTDRPTFELTPFQRLFEGNPNGGDAREII